MPAKFSASNFLDDIRGYGVTYMNYVGKPLAYILATTERDDDADNPLRVAFGNEANDKDIEEFARRFGVQVEDGFGSTENAVIVIHGSSEAFSTGSQPQYPPQPNTAYAQCAPNKIPTDWKHHAIIVHFRVR